MAQRGAKDPISKLAETLRQLPGIGAKNAQRMALHILRARKGFALELADRITEVARETRFCSICQNIATTDPCGMCSEPRRDKTVVCVVQEPQDVVAIEKTGVYNGLFHVLHGALSPLDGIGPDDIRAESLIERAKAGGILEIILATNPNAEGEATAYYIAGRIEPLGVKVSRIARGVPMGGDLEYVDEATLGESLMERRNLLPPKGPRDKQLAKNKKV